MNSGMLILNRGLLADQRGAALVLFTIMLPVIMGLIAMSVDFGRYMNLNTELQDMADAAALAAAAKLDGTTDSITNAINAANETTNEPKWSTVSLTGSPYFSFKFYENNEAYAADEALDNSSEDDAGRASIVQVVTKARTLTGSFIAAVSNKTSAETWASAAAQSTVVACAVTPLMMCNPNEQKGGNFSPAVGSMFRLKETGKAPGKNWAPGDFGLLDPTPDLDGNNKSKLLKQNLARSNPNFCYSATVSPKPGGNAGPVIEAFNTRFDRFDKLNANDLKNIYANITPAGNVIKGTYPVDNKGNVSTKPCDFPNSPPADAAAVPRDACFYNPGTCNVEGIMEWGNGDWKSTAAATKYWTANHGGTPVSVTNRYELYEKELTTSIPTGKEKAAPACAASKGVTGVGGIERRIVYVAVIDCIANGVKGSFPIGAPARKLMKFYITEPATEGTPGEDGNNRAEIYGEFVEMIELSDDDGKLHHIVQLID